MTVAMAIYHLAGRAPIPPRLPEHRNWSMMVFVGGKRRADRSKPGCATDTRLSHALANPTCEYCRKRAAPAGIGRGEDRRREK
jgi:hypothetical protein